jgi:AraC family transcriptional regulator, arabinose operon regulatory protein
MPPAESYVPVLHRLLAGSFTEGPDYATWRSRGTTDWLVINTVDGRGRFGLANGSSVRSSPGDLVLLRPGTPHDYGTAPGSQSWSLQFAHFHLRADWLSLLEWPELAPGVCRLKTTGEARQRITQSFDRAVTMSRGGLAHAELFGLNALESAFLWASTQTPSTRQLDPRLIVVLEQITARLDDPLTVTSLAKTAGLSESRLSHLFANQLGTPPMRFVERQRMQAAEQLLDLTARSVAEVARAVGYEDALYFSTRFKRFAGLSPSAYRHR